MSIPAADLARLTAGKAVANTSLRWIPFFLPTLALAFDASTALLALILGVAEASGLSTLVAGRWLDAGRERFVIIVSLLAIGAACVIALVGTVPAFAAMAVLLGAAAGYVTVGGHAWISARVPFERRARFIGIYEMSWAMALLVGAPIVAGLIGLFGWRGPFIAAALAAVVAAVGIATIDDGQIDTGDSPTPSELDIHAEVTAVSERLGSDVWIVIGVSAAVSMAGLTTIVVAGTWLDEVLGVSTAGIGLVAMLFGAAELIASTSSSALADSLGKRRSMQFSVICVLAGLAIITQTGESLLMGVIGLVVFFLGFEYSIVTSFSLVSEALPSARGRAIGVGSAISTLTRGIGVVAAGFLYERFGISGPAVLSICAAVAAIVFLRAVASMRPDLR